MDLLWPVCTQSLPAVARSVLMPAAHSATAAKPDLPDAFCVHTVARIPCAVRINSSDCRDLHRDVATTAAFCGMLL